MSAKIADISSAVRTFGSSVINSSQAALSSERSPSRLSAPMNARALSPASAAARACFTTASVVCDNIIDISSTSSCSNILISIAPITSDAAVEIHSLASLVGAR